jgi:Uma2 family endonuclease
MATNQRHELPSMADHHDTMSTSADPLVTIEQLGRPPYSERRCELVDGRIVDVSPAHRRHGRIASRIDRALVLWAAPRDAGEVFGAETGFILRRGPDTVRAPDVAFLRKGRDGPDDAFIDGAPDVAVEVLSPGASRREVMDKVGAYLAAGAARVWTVDADDRTLTVHSLDGQSVTLGEGDVLDGGEVLPGFRLELRTVFAG